MTATMPPPCRVPRVPLRAPPGYRFASTAGLPGDIVHLDNDRPYLNARPGEPIVVLKGAVSRLHQGMGEVLGRMDASDPRANARLLPPDTPGLFLVNEAGLNEWRPCQRFHRDVEGRLTLLR